MAAVPSTVASLKAQPLFAALDEVELGSLAFTTVRKRLISLLLLEASAAGHAIEPATLITLPSSQQELAAHVGTVRELVSRNLARLQAHGLIALHGRQLTILNPRGLEADLAASD